MALLFQYARRNLTAFTIVATALGAALCPTTRSHAGDVEARYYIRGTTMKTWYKSRVRLPKNWIENQEWTERYERLVLFENGDMNSTKPVMYVRVHPSDDIALDVYIRTAQSRWKARLPDSRIAPQADVVRTGRPLIKVFLYENPSRPDQAFELTAFMKDRPAKPGTGPLFYQIVLAAPSVRELMRARPAFMELLGNL